MDKPSFLGLPGELRNDIYERMISADSMMILRSAELVHPLAQVSRQIRSEFLPLWTTEAPKTTTKLVAYVLNFDFARLMAFLHTLPEREKDLWILVKIELTNKLNIHHSLLSVWLHFAQTWRRSSPHLVAYAMTLKGDDFSQNAAKRQFRHSGISMCTDYGMILDAFEMAIRRHQSEREGFGSKLRRWGSFSVIRTVASLRRYMESSIQSRLDD